MMKKILPLFIIFLTIAAAGCINSNTTTNTSTIPKPNPFTSSTTTQSETPTTTTTSEAYSLPPLTTVISTTSLAGTISYSGEMVYYIVSSDNTNISFTAGAFELTYTNVEVLNTETYYVARLDGKYTEVIDTENSLTWIILPNDAVTTTIFLAKI